MTFGEGGWMLIGWLDLHANDLPCGRWLAAREEEVWVLIEWMDSKPTTCLVADGLQSISV